MRELEPTKIVSGELVAWTRDFDYYPASEWTLQYRFRGPGPGINVDATANGDTFEVEIAAAENTFTVAGRYLWQAWMTNIATPTDERMATSGFSNVELAFAADSTAAIELRSPAKIAYDTICAALTAFATSDVLEYEISTPAGTRKVKRSDKSQLLVMKKEFAGTVRRENLRDRLNNGGTFGTPINVRVSDR